MRVHITGGKGFLGGYVRSALETTHHLEVSDIDDLDVADLEAVVDGLSGQIDLVCHLAGLTGAADSVRGPDRFFRVNATGTLNVLEACRLNGIPRFLFMSTLTVHGASEKPVDEDSPLLPRHPYGASKAAAEMIVATYARSFGISSAVLRATLIAGEGQAEPNAVSEFAETAAAEGTIDIYGSGLHEREWLHPADLAAAVASGVAWLEAAPPGSFERFIVSSGQPISMKALAEKIVARVGRGSITFSHPTAQAFSLTTQSTKAADVLGWLPRLTIDEIVERVAGLSGQS